MKNSILCLILISITFAGKGQNLVPNGDFEQYSGCPTGFSQIDSALFWMNPSTGGGAGSPDYYNQCATSISVDVPANWGGYHPAHSGEAYSGCYLWGDVGISDSIREYIETPLTTALIPNSCYYFEMYVTLAGPSQYTTDDIGVYFSATPISGINNYYPLPYTPQINNATGNIFDTLNWTMVSGNYIASGGENYLIIGNFNSNANTDTITINNFPTQFIYCFIDYVILTPCTGIEEQNQQGEIKIYPNPVKDYLTIKTKNKAEIIITDFLGKKVLKSTVNNQQSTINVQSYKTGIYFVEINDGKSISRKKFLKE